MGSLESKTSRASPQCDTNFVCICPRVWRSGGRGPGSMDPSRTCPCSPPAPQQALGQAVSGGPCDPPARLVGYKALAPCSTSPAALPDVSQRRQILLWTETLQTTSFPPSALCCSREASLCLRNKKASHGSFWHELPLEIWECSVAKGWPKGSWQLLFSWALMWSLQKAKIGWGSYGEDSSFLLETLKVLLQSDVLAMHVLTSAL